MIFHENCLLADNSHEISYLIFFRKLAKMSQNLSSAVVVIGALRVNFLTPHCCLLITIAIILDQDQARHFVRPDLDPNCLTL